MVRERKGGEVGAETAGWGGRRFGINTQPETQGGEGGARAEQSKALLSQAPFTVRST